MEKDFYTTLIYKELKGELLDSEAEMLKAFYDESEANRTLRDEIQLSWMLSQDGGASSNLDIDIEADLGKVKSTLGHSVEREQTVKVVPMWRRLATIAAVVIPLLGIGFFIFQNMNQDIGEPQIYTASYNEIKEVQLKDGTKIWLNWGTELEVAADFNGSERNVKLDGEAYFEVAKNQEKPFNIQADAINVTVLGTSFNIKKSETEQSVSVMSGKVKVVGSDNAVILEKNEKAIYIAATEQLAKDSLLNKNEIAWKTKVFIYKNESLGSVVSQLETLFSKRITIENEALLTCKISFVSNATDLQTILKKVADAVKGEFQQTDHDAFQISGGSCE